MWDGSSKDSRELSDSWTGRTIFDLVKEEAPPGYRRVQGQLVRVQQTTRPDHVLPCVWSTLSPKQKKTAQAEGEILQAQIKEARRKRGVHPIPLAQSAEYLRIMKQARDSCAYPAAPALLCIQVPEYQRDKVVKDYPRLRFLHDSSGRKRKIHKIDGDSTESQYAVIASKASHNELSLIHI